MKRTLLTKIMLLLCALIAGSSSVWAEDTETTYTFSSKSWAASPDNWSGTKDGNQYNASATPKGVQVCTGQSGVVVTSPKSFSKVKQVIVTYSSSSKGVGSIEVKVGSTSLGSQGISISQTETDLTYNASNLDGSVSFTCTCTKNSMGINSVKIVEAEQSAPSITANDVDIAYNATNGSIGYELQNATGNVSASITTGGDWLTSLGTVTASAVPFNCSANTATTARTATVTLSFTDAADKVVTITQAAAPVVDVSLTPTKTYTTLTSQYALDFTDISGLEAYIVKDNDASDGYITMTKVNKVPANTGLVLVKTSGTTFNVPVFDGTGADDVTGNKMAGSATATTAVAENAGYILKDGAFHPSSGGDLPAGKAYLNIEVSAPTLVLDFGGTTGVNEVRGQKEEVRGEFYNLAGQRVANPTKGLYIVNGRKVVIK